MPNNHDVLHGVSLASILDALLDEYGFDGLDSRLRMNCFLNNPSIKSSLTFLRKTDWAREKVEELYVEMIQNQKEAE